MDARASVINAYYGIEEQDRLKKQAHSHLMEIHQGQTHAAVA